ncbi:hypothetical protein Z968_10245 [Clostridium novyi A str. 4552]|uniref:Uncharacterized protein n=1 Tax=Clostridium novyi A str. 4552 TaxID=1444289 RepID=A0A0A0I3W8_CLONO|nr:hypothetical protein [Clostridium novyi]KGM95016.1 hypothetical protein Z968_10245 [Clostridium novyi A str. 4552]
MEKDMISISEDNIKKILSELKEIENLASDDVVKFKADQLMQMIGEMTSIDSKETLEQIIYKKMKESATNNPELNVKLYMLYRNLKDGKVSQKEAKEAYEIYIQMYPYDTLVY